MQIKSLNKRLKLSSGASSSDHSRTLAGFQKYVEDLVDAYQKGASSGLQKGTVDLIRDYLVQLWNTFRQEHTRDKKMRDWCGTPAMSNTQYQTLYLDQNVPRCDACNDDDSYPEGKQGEFCGQCANAKGLKNDCSGFKDELITGNGAIHQSEVILNDTKEEHDTCRQGRYEDCTNEACRYFDKYRLTRTWTWSQEPGDDVDFSFSKCTNALAGGVLVGGIRGMLRKERQLDGSTVDVLLHEDPDISNRTLQGLNEVNYGVVSTTWFHHWDSDEAQVVNHKRRRNMLPMGWTHHGNDEVHSHEVCSVNTDETPFLPECVKEGHVLPTYMTAARQSNGKVVNIDATNRQVAIGTGITPTSQLVMFEKCLVAIRAWLGPRSDCYDHYEASQASPKPVADPWGYTITVPNQGDAWTGSNDAVWTACRGTPGTKDATTIPGLWPLLRACRVPRAATEASGAIGGDCGTKQQKFEEAHCNHYQLVGYHCHELSECIRTETDSCGKTNYAVTGEGPANLALGAGGAHKLTTDWTNTGFTETGDITTTGEAGGGTCGDIQKKVEQRQSDNETMEHIDCLLAALIAATQGDPGTADQYQTGDAADLTFTSANGAEQNQNSYRNSFRCTATFNTMISATNVVAEEGAECTCDTTETKSQNLQYTTAEVAASPDLANVIKGVLCQVGGEEVDQCDCTTWEGEGQSQSVHSYIGQEVAFAKWNKERANATMRFCKGENYRAPTGTADSFLTVDDDGSVQDNGQTGSVEYRATGTWTTDNNDGTQFNNLKTLVDNERLRVSGDTNYHAGLEIAEKYDYFSIPLGTVTKNFKQELVYKWVQWLIPCQAMCDCQPCTIPPPPCTEGGAVGGAATKKFKDEYYTLESKNFDITLATSELRTASEGYGGKDGSGDASGHVPERYGDNIYAIPGALEITTKWMDLNKDYDNDEVAGILSTPTSLASRIPSIPRGFEIGTVATDKGGSATITVEFETEVLGVAPGDNSVNGYTVWNRAACWDVQMCDITAAGASATSGKCHSYYEGGGSTFHSDLESGSKFQGGSFAADGTWVQADSDNTNDIELSDKNGDVTVETLRDTDGDIKAAFSTTTDAADAQVLEQATMTTEEISADGLAIATES